MVSCVQLLLLLLLLLLARLMGKYCFSLERLLSVVVCRRLSSSIVVCNAAVRRARGRSGGRQRMAGQCGYVPLGRHLVIIIYYYFTVEPLILQPLLLTVCNVFGFAVQHIALTH